MKIKKFLLSGSVAALLLPALALAAYNDVTLTTDAIVSSGGVSLTVSGSTAAVESIVVGASSFTVTLLPGSSVEFSSASRYTIGTNAPAGFVETDTCSATESRLKLRSSISTGTITITPSATTCSGNASGNSTTVVSTGGGSGSSSVGGGGGGGGYTPPAATTPATPATPAAPATSVTPAVPATPASASLTTDFGVGAKGNSVASLQTLLEAKGFLTMPTGVAKGTYGALTRSAVRAYQKSKGISQTGYVGPLTRAAINAELGASASAASPAVPATVVASENAGFKRDLETGSKGSDVKALQAYLNSHGFQVSASGAGSPGNETELFGGLTRAALAKWQASVGITPAAGYFGPKTRAYIAANP